MRNLLTLTLILAFASSCIPKQEGVLLTGMVENLEKGLFIIGGPGGSRDTVMLDEAGNFTWENPEIIEAGNYYLIFGQEVIYISLAPGMEMDFYADMKNLKETMGFSGKGSDINNYYSAKKSGFDYNWYKLDPDEFRFKADSLLAMQQADFLSAEKKNPEDPFWKTEEADLLYSWANYLEMFPSYHEYYSQITDYEAPDDWFAYRDQLDINNPENTDSRSFASYVSTRVNEAAGEKEKSMREADSTVVIDSRLLRMETAMEMLENEKVRNNFLTTTITDAMQWTDLSELEKSIEFFKEKVQDEEMLAKFNAENEAWQKLSKGAPMFDFVGKDLEGNTVNSTDFRGKYLYVDVWATWCGPCIYEIPFLKQLEADYHDRNIVFLSYSIDEDKDAWLKYVPEKELGGVQIIGENAWQSQLCKDYKIRGVPTFMFFDPEGKIVSSKMTRPSNQATRDTFDSYSDL